MTETSTFEVKLKIIVNSPWTEENLEQQVLKQLQEQKVTLISVKEIKNATA